MRVNAYNDRGICVLTHRAIVFLHYYACARICASAHSSTSEPLCGYAHRRIVQAYCQGSTTCAYASMRMDAYNGITICVQKRANPYMCLKPTPYESQIFLPP